MVKEKSKEMIKDKKIKLLLEAVAILSEDKNGNFKIKVTLPKNWSVNYS